MARGFGQHGLQHGAIAQVQVHVIGAAERQCLGHGVGLAQSFCDSQWICGPKRLGLGKLEFRKGLAMLGRMIFGVVLGFAGPAMAQDVDCTNAMTQNEMTYCAEQDWNSADRALNVAYKVAVAAAKEIDAGLDAKDQGALDYLKQAQRAWITFRDAACAAEGYAMHGGSAEPMVIYGCRARLTRERTEGLYYIGFQD